MMIQIDKDVVKLAASNLWSFLIFFTPCVALCTGFSYILTISPIWLVILLLAVPFSVLMAILLYKDAEDFIKRKKMIELIKRDFKEEKVSHDKEG